MPYYKKQDLPSKEIIPGLTLRSVWIDKLMITMVDLKPGCVVLDVAICGSSLFRGVFLYASSLRVWMFAGCGFQCKKYLGFIPPARQQSS